MATASSIQIISFLDPWGSFDVHRVCEGRAENKVDVTLVNLAGNCRGPAKLIQELFNILADLGANFVGGGMEKLSGFACGSKINSQL